MPCDKEQDAIPAASAIHCFNNGGKFIRDIYASDRNLRCVSERREDMSEEQPLKVNWMAFRYNVCTLHDMEEEIKNQALTDAFGDPL